MERVSVCDGMFSTVLFMVIPPPQRDENSLSLIAEG
jgi:hypothetical protein